MKRIYYLSTCSTCKTIMKTMNLSNEVELFDIKHVQIDPGTIDWLKSKVGSYEALFSKRAVKYKSLSAEEQPKTDDDFRELLLTEYTFLKRPFCINGEEVVIGNSKEAAQKAMHLFA